MSTEMHTATTALDVHSPADDLAIEGLEEMLADMDSAASDDVVIEEVAGDEGALEEVVAEIGVDEARKESYEAQESAASVDTEAKAAEPSETPAETKPARKTGTTRTKGSINDLDAATFQLVASDADRDPADLKAEVIGLRPAAKKIAEKFDNIFLALAAGKLPSVYTVAVFKALREKALTSTEIVKALEMAGYSIGTSRSQAQQVINLFQTLKVASKSDGKLGLNADSVIGAALAVLIDAPAAEETPAAE